MTEPLHPAATHHLPSFITAPGETDWLMTPEQFKQFIRDDTEHWARQFKAAGIKPE